MSRPTLPKVEKLQTALHAKAKRSPGFRFYSLYDQVSRSDVLWVAYMRRFVLGWTVFGYETRLQARIVNSADDFVICCRGTVEEAMAAMRSIMGKLTLTVNERKTHLCRVPDESFDFPGYTIGPCHSPKTGRAYIGTRPSKKPVQRLCREISETTGRRWTPFPVEDRIARLNRTLIGWSNAFCLGPVSEADRRDRGFWSRNRRSLGDLGLNCSKAKVWRLRLPLGSGYHTAKVFHVLQVTKASSVGHGRRTHGGASAERSGTSHGRCASALQTDNVSSCADDDSELSVWVTLQQMPPPTGRGMWDGAAERQAGRPTDSTFAN